MNKKEIAETMATALGYKDKITWETIQTPYVPEGKAMANIVPKEHENTEDKQ